MIGIFSSHSPFFFFVVNISIETKPSFFSPSILVSVTRHVSDNIRDQKEKPKNRSAFHSIPPTPPEPVYIPSLHPISTTQRQIFSPAFLSSSHILQTALSIPHPHLLIQLASLSSTPPTESQIPHHNSRSQKIRNANPRCWGGGGSPKRFVVFAKINSGPTML